MSMDIEDLNKSQIILLTLLVSFVTSIATGIVTVSLMEKAPKDVVRVTQKVVERVVEKVEQANPIKKDEPVKEKIIEKTVIVKEGDVMAQSIAENRIKVLSIYEAESDKFLAFAFPAQQGSIVTDASIYKEGMTYKAKNSKGEIYDIEYVRGGGARGLALFKVLNTDKKPRPLTLSENSPSLGQSIFLFVTPDLSRVSQSIISTLKKSLVYADIKQDYIFPGTLIFNSKGGLVGISTKASREAEKDAFVSAASIQAFLEGGEQNPADVQRENTDKQSNSNASSTEITQESQGSKNKNGTQNASTASATP